MAKSDAQTTQEFSPQEAQFMKAALRLAARAQGQTTPNPAAGAVIVRNGRIAGQGFHLRAGEDHAEVAALRDANQPVAGATMYVTLEPCCHHGQTPPCVEALIEAGLKRVVVATRDPNPQVNGQGIRRLREAGMEVSVGLMRDEAIRLNEAFMHFHLTARPLVVCKWAMTLDGQMAATSGDARWITNAESRRYVHRLRSRSDAVMAGIGTVLIDNPSLNVRLPDYRGRQPIRIIADGGLRSPRKANCIQTQPGGPTWFLATAAAPPERAAALERIGCRVLRVAGRGQIIDFKAVIRLLGREGVQSILVEGGPTVHAALAGAGLCDKTVAFVSPKVIGVPPHYRRNPVYGWGKALMSEASLLHEVRIRHFETDVCIEGDARPWQERFGAL